MFLKYKLNKSIAARSEIRSESGFSLITIALALAVIGIMMVPAIHMYNISVQAEKVARNKASTALASAALNKYFLVFGHYPTPAKPGVAQGTAEFGHSVEKPVPPAVWPDCKIGSTLDTDVCATTEHTVGGASVLIGVLPFADLNIPFTSILDAHKNLLTYAVTTDQTVPGGGFNENGGKIIVLDSVGDPIYSVTSSSHFVIVGHGDDAKGAFGQNGKRNRACGTNTDSIDFENCNRDGTFRSNVIKDTVSIQINDGLGAEHFDDYVQERNSTTSGIWSYMPQTSTTSLSITDRMGGNVATGDCDGRSPCVPVSRFDIYGNGETGTPAVRAPQVDTARFCGRGNGSGDGPGTGGWACINDYALAVNDNTEDPLYSTCIGTECPSSGAAWDHDHLPPWLTAEMLVGETKELDEDTSPYWMNESSHGHFHRGNGILCVGERALSGIFDYDEACNDTSNFLDTPSRSALIPCTGGRYAVGITAAGAFDCQLPSENKPD